jgi:hypothetical protein
MDDKIILRPVCANDNGHAIASVATGCAWKGGDLCIVPYQGQQYCGAVLDTRELPVEKPGGSIGYIYDILVNTARGAFWYHADDLVRPTELNNKKETHP